MSQPRHTTPVPAKEAYRLAREAREARDGGAPLGFIHRTPVSWRHCHQPDWTSQQCSPRYQERHAPAPCFNPRPKGVGR